MRTSVATGQPDLSDQGGNCLDGQNYLSCLMQLPDVDVHRKMHDGPVFGFIDSKIMHNFSQATCAYTEFSTSKIPCIQT